jgi:serine/threonine protein kinase
VQRLGGLQLANAEEVRALLARVQEQLNQAGLRGEVRPEHSCSIHGEEERQAVKALLVRFRRLPAGEQAQVPALLNGLGKLQVGTGDFPGARQTFDELARAVDDPSARAEARHNAYRALLEMGKWPEALEALREAADLDPPRFAPFPLGRYAPQRILGAGGFGTVFHCRDTWLRNRDVAVKALHAADLARGIDQVFAEAHALMGLNDPAIIGVHDVGFGDPVNRRHPYVVMQYFPGDSLGKFVRERGKLPAEELLHVARQVAAAMKQAHARDVLHRDLKPDNILVRKEGPRWQVKLIDFGLALRREAVETGRVAGSSERSIRSASVTGTLKYAPPEQTGELPGTKVGPYSDVYAFGKTCCYALFGTTEPRGRHLSTLPGPLRELLERCLEQELEYRYPDFGPVLQVLEALDPAPKAEAEWRKREEEAGRQAEEERRQELARVQQEGKVKLARLIREVLDRTHGSPTREDNAAASELCRQHRIPREQAEAVVHEVREQWQKEHLTGRPPGERLTNLPGTEAAPIPPRVNEQEGERPGGQARLQEVVLEKQPDDGLPRPRGCVQEGTFRLESCPYGHLRWPGSLQVGISSRAKAASPPVHCPRGRRSGSLPGRVF